MSEVRKCPNCQRRVTGHPNKRFCGSKCKDRYHNRTNPRGFYRPTVDGVPVPRGFTGITDQEYEQILNSLEEGWDGHKS